MVSSLPLGAILGVGFCLLVLVIVIGAGLFSFIFKAGVVVNEARRPPHHDSGVYTLDQGREVRSEEERR